jgi:hypothetical protein
MASPETALANVTDSRAKSHLFLLLACALGVFAYLPSLNNGFIADDYVILYRVEMMKTQPLYLQQAVPENFRFVSYIIFGILKAGVGYQAWVFYVANIALHLLNIVLLSRLLDALIGDRLIVRLAVVFFAVFQAGQEAVMWLAAMNETTQFLATVVTLLLWWRGRYVLATTTYAVALFCKESAIIIPVLVILLDFYKYRTIFRRTQLLLLIPTILFATVFLLTASQNFMFTNRSYGFGFRAIFVLGRSLHRLLWPWFYIVLVLVWLKTRRPPSWSQLVAYLAVVIVVMLPYTFVLYQSSLTSRQVYLACAVLMTLFSVMLRPIAGTPLLKLFVTVFVAFNIGYLWFRKDGQFEERAAPTTQLVRKLRTHSPQKTLIVNFAYPYPDIAHAAALAAPGWTSDLIVVNDQPCDDCWRLTWNSVTHHYE